MFLSKVLKMNALFANKIANEAKPKDVTTTNLGKEIGSKLIQGVTIKVVSGPTQAMSCANLTTLIFTSSPFAGNPHQWYPIVLELTTCGAILLQSASNAKEVSHAQ